MANKNNDVTLDRMTDTYSSKLRPEPSVGVTKDNVEYIRQWLRDHPENVQSQGSVYATTKAIENLDSDKKLNQLLKGVTLDDILPHASEEGKLVIDGNEVDLSYLPDYSTSAQGAYADYLARIQDKVAGGDYDVDKDSWNYDRTVDDFLDPDTDKQMKQASDKAFQRDWTGGLDYGSILQGDQAAVDKYQSNYEEALVALDADRQQDYKYWKDAYDTEQADKQREYTYDMDYLSQLQNLATEEATRNENLNSTLSNLGMSYANLMSNQGLAGVDFMDLLSPTDKERLTGIKDTAKETTGI